MTSTARESLGRTLLIIGRLALAGIFLFAAYAKLKPQAAMGWSASSVKISLSMFAMQVDSYQLLPPQLVGPAAHFLPLFELFLGLWLLSGVLFRYAALTTTLLLGAFFAMMVRTYRMGLEINCGCFGPGERLGVGTLVRDGSLLAFAIAVTVGAFVISRRSRNRKANPASASSLSSAQPAG
jgi:uncharacterized membrane protein YphA (DoxX/SURF4 family)